MSISKSKKDRRSEVIQDLAAIQYDIVRDLIYTGSLHEVLEESHTFIQEVVGELMSSLVRMTEEYNEAKELAVSLVRPEDVANSSIVEARRIGDKLVLLVQQPYDSTNDDTFNYDVKVMDPKTGNITAGELEDIDYRTGASYLGSIAKEARRGNPRKFD